MKTWPWGKIGLRLLLSPRKFIALRKLPRKFVTLDEWHEANLAKAEIAASVIGCECVHDLKEQEEEFMKYRKSICTTMEEWSGVVDEPEHDNAIRRIIEKYRQQKRCHRDFYGPQAGIRCYCDEHSHLKIKGEVKIMKRAEKEAAKMVVTLFRERKINFSYFYNPLYTFDSYDRRIDHQFIAEYDSLTIRLTWEGLLIDDKEAPNENFLNTPLTKELKKIYTELYHKHEAEIKRVEEGQKDQLKREHKMGNPTLVIKKLKSIFHKTGR